MPCDSVTGWVDGLTKVLRRKFFLSLFFERKIAVVQIPWSSTTDHSCNTRSEAGLKIPISVRTILFTILTVAWTDSHKNLPVETKRPTETNRSYLKKNNCVSSQKGIDCVVLSVTAVWRDSVVGPLNAIFCVTYLMDPSP